MLFGNKIFKKELLAPFCLHLGTDEKQKSRLKSSYQPSITWPKKEVENNSRLHNAFEDINSS